MNQRIKTIILIIVLVGIAGAILLLESMKVPQTRGEPQTVQKIAPQSNSGTSTNTSARTDQENIQRIADKTKKFTAAKELIPGGKFINTPELKLKDIVGKKVILLDFWTYSCINCLRTLPYLKEWHKKYSDKGLVIIGVHTPEFDFEKNSDNVAKAVKDLGVPYPVMQDNNYATWNAYGNQYWPHEYLIDIDGFIVHDHIGEGSYDETETAIQNALQERSNVLNMGITVGNKITAPSDAISFNSSAVQSPEIYFGYARNEYLANGQRSVSGTQHLTVPSTIDPNMLYLDGDWNFNQQFAENTNEPSRILFKYNAKNVYIVASSDKGVTVTVLKDGRPLVTEAGKDVRPDGTVLIKDNRLYRLIEGADYGQHTIEIIIHQHGLRAFTFTFG